MDLFENATKYKYRFDSDAGKLSSEDLWDLPLISRKLNVPSLDSVAKTIAKKIKESEEESFVVTTKTNTLNEQKLEIVKHIIAIRLEENAKAEDRVKKKAHKELIKEAINKKQIEATTNKSLEELQAEYESL